MQDAVNSQGTGPGHEQSGRKLAWWWEGLSTLAIVAVLASVATLANVLLRKIGPHWGDVSYLILGVGTGMLWLMRRSGVGRARGFPAGRVSLLMSYRSRPMPLALLVIYAVTLLVGAWPLARPWLDAGKASYQLILLFFMPASLPFEAVNWSLARRADDRLSLRRALALWLPALLVAEAACWIVLQALEHRYPGVLRPLHHVAGLAAAPCYLLFLMGAHRTALKWQSLMDAANERAHAAETARQLAEARLALLQAQIEPHFLFNTLATVQYLVKSDPVAADFLLSQLTRYLRLAMPSMRQLSSTLGREFELTEAYLQITKLRMGGRLEVGVDLPAALAAAEFPSMVLQTLVENAIKHGVEPKPGPVRIRVFARQVGGELHVGVQDDGVGLGGAQTQGSGTGLQNIRERLQGIHGARAKLYVAGLADGGVLASVTLPMNIATA